MILQALKKVLIDYSAVPAFDSREVLAGHMAKRTTGLSAGDVSAILREAAMASMRDDLQATAVSIKYVLQALDEATGTSSTALKSATATPLFARRNTGSTRDKSRRSDGPRASIRSNQARRKAADARRFGA